MFFGAIRSVVDNIKALESPKNISFLMQDVLSDKLIQAQILDLNTQSQLYEKGVDAKGISLGSYSKFTVRYKTLIAPRIGNDSRADHLTYKDTGEFYKSFRFDNQKTQFKISANTIKDGGIDLLTREPDLLGLTSDSLNEVKEMVIGPLRSGVKTFILRKN